MREYTTVIISEADRLVTLVDTLLGPGHFPRKESINIHELLAHVGHLLAADAPPGVVIDRDYDPSLPPLQSGSQSDHSSDVESGQERHAGDGLRTTGAAVVWCYAPARSPM